jgi:hypothetical protein
MKKILVECMQKGSKLASAHLRVFLGEEEVQLGLHVVL